MFSSGGSIDGDGIDDIGTFAIRGHFNLPTLQARWTKTYTGRHSVEYEGVYDGRNILGTWTLSWINGPFRIWPGSSSSGMKIEAADEIEVGAHAGNI